MSLELPEAYILAAQMNKEIVGKTVQNCTLRDCTRFQDLGFINPFASDFDRLNGGKIENVASRGNVVRVKADNAMNLILAPEYGGKILYQPAGRAPPEKWHLKVAFTDASSFTVTLTGMGIIQGFIDEELKHSYVYRRDFSDTAYPLDETFTFDSFSRAIVDRNVNVKTVLVGKDAVIVGLSNSLFQDVIFRAGIYPKRKAAELGEAQRRALYDSVKHVIGERIRLGGKDQFVDFYGKPGTYVAAMGPNMKEHLCLACGAEVEKMALGGGQVYFCPSCQKP